MDQQRQQQPRSAPRNDIERESYVEEAAREKSELNQHVDQFLRAFDEDYRKSIEKRNLKEDHDA